MPTADYTRLPFPEAIDYLAGKINLDTDSWRDGQGVVQDAAFTVARAKGQLLEEIRAALDKAIAEGKSVDEFVKSFDSIASRWADDWNLRGDKGWRGQLIYEQNLRQAYAAGRYKQMTDPEVVKLRPYWQWRHGGSARPRPAHLAMDGRVYPAGSLPFFPPAGFGCFPGETEVATLGGWKRLESIEVGELVLGGSGDFQPILQTHKRMFDGELIEIGVDDRRFFATPNHRFLTLRGWIQASNLKVDDELVQIHQVALINKIVADVQQPNPLPRNLHVPMPVDFSIGADALNANSQASYFDINPVGAHIKIELNPPTLTSQKIDHTLLASCRRGLGVQVKGGVFSKLLQACSSGAAHDIWIKKRAIGFEFLRNLASGSINLLCLAVSRMVDTLLVGDHPLHDRAANIPAVGVSLPLTLNSFGSSDAESVKIQEPHDRSVVEPPSSGQFSYREQPLTVADPEGFVSGAPLNAFDSLEDFVAWARSHCQLTPIKKIGQLYYTDNVYNLTTPDESYCLRSSVVHNCQCTVFSLSDRDLSRESLTVEPLQLGQELSYIDPATGQTKTTILQPDEGFNRIPGVTTPAQRRQLIATLRPDIRAMVLGEFQDLPFAMAAGQIDEMRAYAIAKAPELPEGARRSLEDADGILSIIKEYSAEFPNNFLGVADVTGTLQAVAFTYDGGDHLALNCLAAAPWNNPFVRPTDPRYMRQAGTEALLRVIERSIAAGHAGEVRLSPMSGSVEFYQRRGFVPANGQYVLTADAAQSLIKTYEKRYGRQTLATTNL